MLNPADYHDLISGRRRGWLAAVQRGGLGLLELPYAAAVHARNALFDSGLRGVSRVSVPVVSVGNLTVGGTGKTPFVAWLAHFFRRHAVRVVLVSRGYRRNAAGRNDEALDLEWQLPNVPHVQNPDRVAGARAAVHDLAAQVVVLDDGFQHRRLRRDLDIVLLDALEPFGCGHLLPRGLLREPLRGLRRADLVVLTRADLVTPDQRRRIHAELERWHPAAERVEVAFRPRGLRAVGGDPVPLKPERIAAFCGIGNPEGFRRTLAACGYHVVAFRAYPDHHDYPRRDREELARWTHALPPIRRVVCTQKDLVKLRLPSLGRYELCALVIETHILQGRAALESRLAPLLSAAVTAES